MEGEEPEIEERINKDTDIRFKKRIERNKREANKRYRISMSHVRQRRQTKVFQRRQSHVKISKKSIEKN